MRAAPQELLDSGYLTEVHKFSKFIHGSATLFPGDVRAVPYWVDDESVRASMLASAPQPPDAGANGSAAAAGSSSGSLPQPLPHAGKPRKDKTRTATVEVDELHHPLLGDGPTLKLMPDPNSVQGG